MSNDYLKTKSILTDTLHRKLEDLQFATERLLKCPAGAPEYEEFLFEESKFDYACSLLDSLIRRLEDEVENEDFDFNT